MTKVAVNKCHGGFSLSEAGVRAYAKRKGKEVYPEPISPGHSIMIYWTTPKDQRPKAILSEGEFHSANMEDRRASNAAYCEHTISGYKMPRDDVDLIAVIEELGSEADGKHAKIEVVDIPDDVKWQVEEYDGFEHVAEAHQTW